MGKKQGILLAVCIVSTGLMAGCGKSSSENITNGMSQIQNMDYAGAADSFLAALEGGEDERLSYRGLGIAYMGMTDYEQAVENFETCLKLSDGMLQNVDFDVNYFLATSQYKNGDAAAAQQTYTAILALRPEEVDAHYLRGIMRLSEGEYETAQVDFEKVLKLAGNDCNRLIEIYEALEEHGYTEIGRKYLSEALESGADKLKAYDKGRIYYYLQDYKNACNYLEESRDSGTADAYLYLGRAYEATGDYNYAASVYNSYIAKDPGNAVMHNQLGLCKLQQGEYSEALTCFQTAMNIEANGIMQTLQFNEIVAYEYLGEYQKAAVLMDNYIATYPDDEAAKRENEFLKTR